MFFFQNLFRYKGCYIVLFCILIGVNCELDINECFSSPCLNGTCNDMVNMFSCTCHDGYDGTICDHEINECDVFEPCQNAAQCFDLVADYRCECPIYADNTGGMAEILYAGKNCSVQLMACDAHECQNDAWCRPYLIAETLKTQNYTCICAAGTTGQYCHIFTACVI